MRAVLILGGIALVLVGAILETAQPYWRLVPEGLVMLAGAAMLTVGLVAAELDQSPMRVAGGGALLLAGYVAIGFGAYLVVVQHVVFWWCLPLFIVGVVLILWAAWLIWED
jgi:hypothetical protein